MKTFTVFLASGGESAVEADGFYVDHSGCLCFFDNTDARVAHTVINSHVWDSITENVTVH